MLQLPCHVRLHG